MQYATTTGGLIDACRCGSADLRRALNEGDLDGLFRHLRVFFDGFSGGSRVLAASQDALLGLAPNGSRTVHE
jgi:hypothetical protein